MSTLAPLTRAEARPTLSPPRSMRNLAARVWLAGCLFAAVATALWWYVSPSIVVTKTRMDQMTVGRWVLSGNPSGERDTEFGTEVDPASWRLLHLEAPKADGSSADVWMLRPTSWLEEQWRDQYAWKVTSLFEVPVEGTPSAVGAASESESVQLVAIEHDELTDPKTGARLQGPEIWVPQYDEKLLSGGTLYVSVPECGIDGHARVLSIGECPQVSPRPGPEFQVVTATFHHHGATIIDVGVSGLAETIGATPNHPFWREDKQDFVRADELHVGEQLRQADGSLAQVASLVPRAGLHDVYNLEVQVEHTYHVGASGVLVHNGNPEDCIKWAQRSTRGGQKLLLEPATDGGRYVASNLPGYTLYEGMDGWPQHALIKKGGKVFDSAHPRGIRFSTWVRQMKELNPYMKGMTIKEIMRDLIKVTPLPPPPFRG